MKNQTLIGKQKKIFLFVLGLSTMLWPSSTQAIPYVNTMIQKPQEM